MYRYAGTHERLNRGVAVSFTVNLKSAQLYIPEKTTSLVVTDNHSLEKDCNIMVKHFAF